VELSKLKLKQPRNSRNQHGKCRLHISPRDRNVLKRADWFETCTAIGG
jgi:hypothetical protein